jgi:hypothetical protein
VQKGLTWFEDAEAETVSPSGMTPKLWRDIRTFLEAEVARTVRGGARPRRRR